MCKKLQFQQREISRRETSAPSPLRFCMQPLNRLSHPISNFHSLSHISPSQLQFSLALCDIQKPILARMRPWILVDYPASVHTKSNKGKMVKYRGARLGWQPTAIMKQKVLTSLTLSTQSVVKLTNVRALLAFNEVEELFQEWLAKNQAKSANCLNIRINLSRLVENGLKN